MIFLAFDLFQKNTFKIILDRFFFKYVINKINSTVLEQNIPHGQELCSELSVLTKYQQTNYQINMFGLNTPNIFCISYYKTAFKSGTWYLVYHNILSLTFKYLFKPIYAYFLMLGILNISAPFEYVFHLKGHSYSLYADNVLYLLNTVSAYQLKK